MAKNNKEQRTGLDSASILKRDLKSTAFWIALSVGMVILVAVVQRNVL